LHADPNGSIDELQCSKPGTLSGIVSHHSPDRHEHPDHLSLSSPSPRRSWHRQKHPDGSIDLVYIDSPFNSKRDDNVLFEGIEKEDATAQKQRFADGWSNVSYPDTGGFYLHCDPDMSHYRELLCDLVFNESNSRNEIIWKHTSAQSGADRYGSVHDKFRLLCLSW
jgi:hypothetical protein